MYYIRYSSENVNEMEKDVKGRVNINEIYVSVSLIFFFFPRNIMIGLNDIGGLFQPW